METLWAPWRHTYISGNRAERNGVPEGLAAWPGPHTDCVFCNMLGSVRWATANGMPELEARRAANILRMGETCFVCLNAFPYISGHLMIVPYQHLSRLSELSPDSASEMMRTAQQVERVLQEVYHPGGLNFGCNLGEAAGAGIANHLHLHALPRWVGDTNFMTTISDTRVLSEALQDTWHRLLPLLTERATQAPGM